MEIDCAAAPRPQARDGAQERCFSSAIAAKQADAITGFESEEAAICTLTALRDGTPGKFEILWGEMGDEGINYMEVYSGGKDSVYIEWELDCQGCPESGALGRSGQLTLQPDSFFDACLAQPDTASLIQCVFGFVDFQAGSPPPATAPPRASRSSSSPRPTAPSTARSTSSRRACS